MNDHVSIQLFCFGIAYCIALGIVILIQSVSSNNHQSETIIIFSCTFSS